MSEFTVTKPGLEWQEVFLSFVPPAKRTSHAKDRLTAWRLPLIMVLQAVLTWRLTDVANDDEALYIHGGQVVIAHLLHGGAANAALLHLYGSYFSGAPNAYPVVAAALDAVGGLILVLPCASTESDGTCLTRTLLCWRRWCSR